MQKYKNILKRHLGHDWPMSWVVEATWMCAGLLMCLADTNLVMPCRVPHGCLALVTSLCLRTCMACRIALTCTSRHLTISWAMPYTCSIPQLTFFACITSSSAIWCSTNDQQHTNTDQICLDALCIPYINFNFQSASLQEKSNFLMHKTTVER